MSSVIATPRNQRDDARFVREVVRRHAAAFELDGLALARLVTDQVRRCGRHRLGTGLLSTLDALQRRHLGGDAFLDAFLDAVLARRRGQFRNQTYLALPLVELVRTDLGVEPERMSALLMADVVRHERRPDNAGRLDARTRDIRIRHASRFVASVDPALDVRWLPGEWFAVTALPVSREHDEYFFIRALQAHEMAFIALSDEVRGATQALRDGDIAAATARVIRAGEVFTRAAMLFRLVTTLRPAAFRAFQGYTGASAIPSEAYKRFELACRPPTSERLCSDGFDNAPTVRADAPRPDDFTSAWHDLGDRGPETDALARAVERLEVGHQRWKATHYRLAAATLGNALGSGYTEGVGYLRGCLDNRLFDLDGAAGMTPRRPAAA